jgi:hypothetical protein
MQITEKSKIVWLITVLIILFVLIAIYVGVNEYKKYKENLEFEAYQRGMEDLISDMYKTGKECRLIALDTGDGNHMKLISIDCLEKKQEE